MAPLFWPFSSTCNLLALVGVQHHGCAVQRLDRASALAVGLVAGRAVGGIDFFAAREQCRPSVQTLAGIVGFGGGFLLLGVDPLGVVGAETRPSRGSACRRAPCRTAPGTGRGSRQFFRRETRCRARSRDRILLDAERAGTMKAWITSLAVVMMRTFLFDWHHQRVVDLEQIVVGHHLCLWDAVVGHLAVRGHRAWKQSQCPRPRP